MRERAKPGTSPWHLAALREQAGLSQAQLARKLKTSQQQISRLEQKALLVACCQKRIDVNSDEDSDERNLCKMWL